MNTVKTQQLDDDLRVLIQVYADDAVRDEKTMDDAYILVILRAIVLLSLQLSEVTKKSEGGGEG